MALGKGADKRNFKRAVYFFKGGSAAFKRIKEPFGRVYCYSVAAMLLLHVLVNIGMTIGLMPVMGIPLPLMSYGGSSLLAFSLLIMIAIRLDASTSDNDMSIKY